MQQPQFAGVEAIFFDLDDTLCGYWTASKAGLRAAFEEHPLDGRSPEEFVQAWAASFRDFSPVVKRSDWYKTYLQNAEPTRTEQMRLTLARMGSDDPEHAVRLSKAYMTHRDQNLRLFPGAWEVLERVHERYPLGLITNGPADLQRMEIETLGIGHFFKTILIEGELGEGKPMPTVFKKAEECCGLEPSSILFVGNSYAHDIQPAIEMGWRTVWIRQDSDVPPSATGQAGRPEEMPEGARPPDAIISDLRELLTLVPL